MLFWKNESRILAGLRGSRRGSFTDCLEKTKYFLLISASLLILLLYIQDLDFYSFLEREVVDLRI